MTDRPVVNHRPLRVNINVYTFQDEEKKKPSTVIYPSPAGESLRSFNTKNHMFHHICVCDFVSFGPHYFYLSKLQIQVLKEIRRQEHKLKRWSFDRRSGFFFLLLNIHNQLLQMIIVQKENKKNIFYCGRLKNLKQKSKKNWPLHLLVHVILWIFTTKQKTTNLHF